MDEISDICHLTREAVSVPCYHDSIYQVYVLFREMKRNLQPLCWSLDLMITQLGHFFCDKT